MWGLVDYRRHVCLHPYDAQLVGYAFARRILSSIKMSRTQLKRQNTITCSLLKLLDRKFKRRVSNTNPIGAAMQYYDLVNLFDREKK